jgi:exportin-T
MASESTAARVTSFKVDSQDCLALYLQGAGAAEGQTGRDGKEKRGSDLRMFCQQVVDSALIHK